MNNLFKTILSFAILVLFIVGCKKESFEKQVDNTFTLEKIVDTVYFGKSFNVGIIKTSDIKTLYLSLVSVNENKEVLKDTLIDSANGYIMSKSIDVPSNGDWAGSYVVKLSAANNSLVRTDTIFFKKGVDNYYLVGGSSVAAWEPTTSILFGIFTKDSKTFYEQYGYYTSAGDGIKILANNTNWDGSFGMIKGKPGYLTTSDADNISIAADGFYRLRLDMSDIANATYTLVASKWGIIGDATAKGWDASTSLVAPTSKGSYSWTLTTSLTAGSLKFRENDAWDVNLGVKDGIFQYDGDNISIAAAGTYKITLNLTPGNYSYSVEKQ